MTDQTFKPNWVSPPGDTISDILEERGISQAEFAKRSGFSKKHVNLLIKGKAAITPEAASRLADVLDAPSEFWLTREANYRSGLEYRSKIDLLQRCADWLKELPIADMVRFGWVQRFAHKGQQVAECLRFFSVASVDAWRAQYEQPVVAFRASAKVEKKVGAVAAWIREGERQASPLRCAPFDEVRFRRTLHEARALAAEHEPSRFMKPLIDACAASGIAVVFVRAPKGCLASGAARWLAPRKKGLIILSLRHKTNDHLWFTFFHEAAHLLRHGKRMLFVDLEGRACEEEHEAEANKFAGDLLIPPSEAKRLPTLGQTGSAVKEFADRIGIAPGIVVGRMQKDGIIHWSRLNGLKARYEWPSRG